MLFRLSILSVATASIMQSRSLQCGVAASSFNVVLASKGADTSGCGPGFTDTVGDLKPPAPASKGCGKSPPSTGKKSFTNQRSQRDYWVHVPKDYDSSKPTPVVVMFHGWGYSGKEWTQGAGWGAQSMAPTADSNNFIIVAPTGLQDGTGKLTGNCDEGAGYCSWDSTGGGRPGPEGMTCNPKVQTGEYCYNQTCWGGCKDICSWTACNDDATMVHALLDKIESELCVDTSRVYVGGESNGGLMTWQMGMDSRASRFAALSAVIGLPHRGYDFLPAVLPLPIMGVWGRADPQVPPGNLTDTGIVESDYGWYYATARRVTGDWAKAHGCNIGTQPTKYSTNADGQKGLSCTSFSANCENTGSHQLLVSGMNATAGNFAPVVDCRFDGGHTVEDFIPAMMWEFFSKYQRAL